MHSIDSLQQCMSLNRNEKGCDSRAMRTFFDFPIYNRREENVARVRNSYTGIGGIPRLVYCVARIGCTVDIVEIDGKSGT